MAITWGAYEGSNPLRVGIDISVSGSTATVKYYVGTSSVGAYSDNQVMTYTGAITGSTSFFNSTGNSDTQLVATKTKTVNAGSSYTFAAAISGAYNGVTPSHSRSYTAPVTTPNAPTGLTESAITDDGATLKWTQPSDWNGNDTDDYNLQISKSSTFASGVTTYSIANSTTKVVSGLDPDTTYYWRVQGKNSAGGGSWSGTANFKTLVTPVGTPSVPGYPTFSNIGVTSLRMTWAIPADDGGTPITGYTASLGLDPDMTGGVALDVPANVADFTGLLANTTYYGRVKAQNSAGYGPWTELIPVTANAKTLAGAKVSRGGVMIDVPSFVRVGGVMTAIAPQKRKAGVWSF